MSPRQVTVPGERLKRWLDGFTERHGDTDVTATALTVDLIGADGSRATLAVPFGPLPPVGVDADGEADGDGDGEVDADAELLAALIAHTRRRRLVGVLLVRRGGHAIGVFDGDDLIASKVGSGYVQGATKAGGWSQQRFARRRANQARAAFADAADTAARILLPYVDRLDALVCGGDRAAIGEVLADPRLASLAAKRGEPWLAVPDPRLRVLRATPGQFRAIQITLDP